MQAVIVNAPAQPWGDFTARGINRHARQHRDGKTVWPPTLKRGKDCARVFAVRTRRGAKQILVSGEWRNAAVGDVIQWEE